MDNDLEVPDINCNYVDINSFNYRNQLFLYNKL